MKKLVLSMGLIISATASALTYDQEYIYKMKCPLADAKFGALYKHNGNDAYSPANVNGTFCTVFPNTRYDIGSAMICGIPTLERTEIKVKDCQLGN